MWLAPGRGTVSSKLKLQHLAAKGALVPYSCACSYGSLQSYNEVEGNYNYLHK